MFQRRTARIALVALVAVSVILVTIDFRTGGNGRDGVLDRVRGAVMTVTRPVQQGLSLLVRPIVDGVDGIGDLFAIRRENARLREQVATLAERDRLLTDLRRENDELRDLLDYRDRSRLDAVAASVVSLGANNYEWTATLDVGRAHGVERNMPVVNGAGLVGRVLHAEERASLVLLAIDPTFSVTVMLAESGEIGVLAGGGGQPLAFSPLDPEVALAAGQELVTAAYNGGLYPTGIPVGVVADAGAATSRLTREVQVRPYVDFTRLHHVMVIVNAPVDPLPPFSDADVPQIVPPNVPRFLDPNPGGDGGDDGTDDGNGTDGADDESTDDGGTGGGTDGAVAAAVMAGAAMLPRRTRPQVRPQSRREVEGSSRRDRFDGDGGARA